MSPNAAPHVLHACAPRCSELLPPLARDRIDACDPDRALLAPSRLPDAAATADDADADGVDDAADASSTVVRDGICDETDKDVSHVCVCVCVHL